MYNKYISYTVYTAYTVYIYICIYGSWLNRWLLRFCWFPVGDKKSICLSMSLFNVVCYRSRHYIHTCLTVPVTTYSTLDSLLVHISLYLTDFNRSKITIRYRRLSVIQGKSEILGRDCPERSGYQTSELGDRTQ